jgi:hypothetical protein
MFIYSFVNKGKYLINHIVISGTYLTFYTTSPDCSALQPVINRFKLQSSFADSPEHQFLHHPFVDFSREGDKYPHKHMKFHKEDRLQALKEIFNLFLQRQNDSRLRKKDFIKLRKDLHVERIAFGHKTFPPSIQAALNTYDVHTPFFPKEELPHLLKAFSKYLEENSLSHQAEKLASHAEMIIDKNTELLFYGFGDANTPEDIKLKQYYDNVVRLRLLLLKISTCADYSNYYYTSSIAKTLLTDELSAPIFYVLNNIIESTKTVVDIFEKKSRLLIAGLVAAGVAMTDVYLHWNQISQIKVAPILLRSAVAGLIHYQLFSKPLTYGLSYLSRRMNQQNDSSGTSTSYNMIKLG